MRLVLVLPLRNQAATEQFPRQLYDPSSPSFHQFLSVDEFTALFGPSEEDYNAVIQFAQANGLSIVGTSRNRLNVDVLGTVADDRECLPSEHGRIPASHRRPHLLCARPRADAEPFGAAVAHRRPGQLFDPAARPGAKKHRRDTQCHDRLRPGGIVSWQRHEGGVLRWRRVWTAAASRSDCWSTSAPT